VVIVIVVVFLEFYCHIFYYFAICLNMLLQVKHERQRSHTKEIIYIQDILVKKIIQQDTVC